MTGGIHSAPGAQPWETERPARDGMPLTRKFICGNKCATESTFPSRRGRETGISLPKIVFQLSLRDKFWGGWAFFPFPYFENMGDGYPSHRDGLGSSKFILTFKKNATRSHKSSLGRSPRERNISGTISSPERASHRNRVAPTEL